MPNYDLLPTPENFAKLRNITNDQWPRLSSYKKKAYYNLHLKYLNQHLLDHIDFKNEKEDANQNFSYNTRDKEEWKTAISKIAELEINKKSMKKESQELKENQTKILIELKIVKDELKVIKDENKELLKDKTINGKKIEDLNKRMEFLESEVISLSAKLKKKDEQIIKIKEDHLENTNELIKIRKELEEKILKLEKETARIEVESRRKVIKLEEDSIQREIESQRKVVKLEEELSIMKQNYQNLMIAHQVQVEKNANIL